MFVLEKNSGDCMHASNSEGFPTGATPILHYEVVRAPPDDMPSNRWLFNGFKITNEAYNRFLHASASYISPAGHKILYTDVGDDTEQAEEFALLREQSDDFSLTGYFRLLGLRTHLYVTFGTTDVTPGTGRSRIYQDTLANSSLMNWY